jgi:hypothetical protein
MSSGLEVRVCNVVKIASSGGSQSLGELESHANIDDIVNAIVALDFDGAFVKSDLTSLRETLQLALGAGFPGSAEVIVIGAAGGLSAEELELAGDRAFAVKEFLVANGVPERSVVADMPSMFQPGSDGGKKGKRSKRKKGR